MLVHRPLLVEQVYYNPKRIGSTAQYATLVINGAEVVILDSRVAPEAMATAVGKTAKVVKVVQLDKVR